MSFEWQTEEENEALWQDPSRESEGGHGRARRRWAALLVTVLLVGSAAFFLYREGQRRIEESVAQLEADVLSSHELGQTALAQGDLELFSTLLSGREPAWTAAQKERLEAGILYGHTGRVFGLEPAADDLPAVDVTFSSDLREATVKTTYPYLRPGGGVSETIRLTDTSIYRKGNARWLLAPAAEQGEFWGNWRTRERDFLTLTYPLRDEAIALKLARDLEQKVREMCEQVGCPAGYHVRVRLERTADSLLPLLDPEVALTGRQTVVLPAPTLVGLPENEVAYEALFRGYARHLLLPLLVERQEWRCCDQILFQQALLYRQLTALGVLSDPVTDVDYLYLPDQYPDRNQLRAWWRVDEPVADPAAVPQGVYAAVDFLLATEGNSLFDMHLVLQPALRAWLLGSIDNPAMDDREAAWRAFVRDLMAQAQERVPIPPGLTFPEQELVLVCRVEQDDRMDLGSNMLVRYDPAAQSWLEELDSLTGFSVLAPLLGDDGFYLSQQFPGEESGPLMVDTYLYRAGRPRVLIATSGGREEGMMVMPWANPVRAENVAWVFAPGEAGLETTYSLITPESCSADGCRTEELPGFPAWSPDGRQLLAMSFESSELILRQRPDHSWDEVGRGSFPFWLDGETYGFITQRISAPEEGVWLATTASDEPELWVTANSLGDALPEGRSPYGLRVVSAFAHPLAVDKLLVLSSSGTGMADLFVVQRDSERGSWLESEPLVRHLASLLAPPTGLPVLDGVVKPGRRWLALPVSWENESGLWLYDLEEEKELLSVEEGPGDWLQSYDWSADGEWLARPAGGAIDLVAPGYLVDGRPYRQFVFHDYGVCTALAWQNRAQ